MGEGAVLRWAVQSEVGDERVVGLVTLKIAVWLLMRFTCRR